MNNERKTPKKRSHSMSCTHPEGCCCGASEWNRLVEELEEVREKLAFLRSKGLTVGLLKDGHGERLAYDIEPDSELCDLKHVHRVIDSNIERDAALSRCRELEGALRRIAKWFGEFPPTGKTWTDGSEMSYGAAFGSNGERDYMREIARKALSSPPQAEQKPQTVASEIGGRVE